MFILAMVEWNVVIKKVISIVLNIRRGTSVHVLTAGCKRGSKVFLSIAYCTSDHSHVLSVPYLQSSLSSSQNDPLCLLYICHA
jgi:lipoate-protein ligase B